MEPTFGERLTRWLEYTGTRPASLARAVGVSRAAVHGWMNEAAPTTDRIAPICAALGMTQAKFFGPLPEIVPLAAPPPPPSTPVEAGPDARVMTLEETDAALHRNACESCKGTGFKEPGEAA